MTIPILICGTAFLLIAWPIITTRLSRYDAEDHARAYIHHKEGAA